MTLVVHVLQNVACLRVALENHGKADDVGGALAKWPGEVCWLSELHTALVFFFALGVFLVNQAGLEVKCFRALRLRGSAILLVPRSKHSTPVVLRATVCDGHRVQCVAFAVLVAFTCVSRVVVHVLQYVACLRVALENHGKADDVGGALTKWPGEVCWLSEFHTALVFNFALGAFLVDQAGLEAKCFRLRGSAVFLVPRSKHGTPGVL